jgi:AcrR family transcriptional regulator
MGVIALKAGALPADTTEPPRMGEVLDVAGRLFHEKGYRSTSLADIGAALGMNKASLYHYVRSKEDLVRQLVLRASRRLRDVSRSPGIDSLAPSLALEVLVREHCAVILEHPEGFGLLIQQRRFIEPAALGEIVEREGTYLAHVREIIARGIAQGVFRSMDSSIATALVMDSVNGLLRWYRPQGRLTAAQVVDEIWAYVLAGLSAPVRKTPRVRKANS